MRRIAWIGVFMIAALTLGAAQIAAQSPPVAPVNNVIYEHWGVKVSDPYRYMEQFKDAEVQEWVKGQADYTKAVLDKLPGRDALYTRIETLDAGSPYRIYGVRRMPDGQLFYFKQRAEENLGKVYRRDGLDGEEELLIDPAEMEAPDGGHVSVSFCPLTTFRLAPVI